MGFSFFPWTNFHELNADWILTKMREAEAAIKQAANTVSGFAQRVLNLENSRVSYTTEQQLTNEQQTIARGNIGAAPNVGVVRYNEAQSLDGVYQTRARQNINAASQSDVTELGIKVNTNVDATATKMDKREPRGEGTLFMTSWYNDEESAAYAPALSLDSGLNHRVSILPGVMHGRDGFELTAFDGTNSGPAYIEGVKTPVRDDQAANKGYVDSMSPASVTVTMTGAASGYIEGVSYDDLANYDRLRVNIPGLGYAYTSQGLESPRSFVGIAVVSGTYVVFSVDYSTENNRWELNLGTT